MAAGHVASGRTAPEAARCRDAVQRRDRRRTSGRGRRLQGAGRSVHGRHDRPADRAVHRRGADRVHVAVPHAARHDRRRCPARRPVDRVADGSHDDRRGGRLRHHERGPVLRRVWALRCCGTPVLQLPLERPVRRGVGVHTRHHHHGRHRDRCEARHELRRPVPRPGDDLVSGDRQPTVRRAERRNDRTGGHTTRVWSATGMCCSSPACRRRRGSRT